MLPVLFDRRALAASLVAIATMVVAFVLGFIWLQFRIMSVHDRELFQSLERAIVLTTRMDTAEDRAALAKSLSISNENIPDKRYFVLLSPNGSAIVGDLAKVPERQRALASDSAAYRVAIGDGRDTYVRSTRLADGARFIVVQPDTARFEIAKALGRVAVGIIVFVILIGIATGFVLNRYIMGYVRGLADTARQIMRGQMAARAPAQQRLDAMGALTMTFNEMLDQNEALVTGMRTVTESLAHDLRTPLMRMRRSLAAARVADSEAVREQLLNDAEADVNRALQTFSALIDLARAEAGLSRDSMEELDLDMLAKDMIDLLGPLAEDRGQRLECSISPVKVVGHRQILAQALGNLLENAIKYAPIGSALKLVVRPGADDAGPEIIVEDRGPGIPAHAREQAVKPFVRLEHPSRQPGSGLGLAIAAAVARLHRGKLILENAEPGLRVRLQLGIKQQGLSPAAT